MITTGRNGTSMLTMAEKTLPILQISEVPHSLALPIDLPALVSDSPWLRHSSRMSRFLSGTRRKGRLRRLRITEYNGADLMNRSERYDSRRPRKPD